MHQALQAIFVVCALAVAGCSGDSGHKKTDDVTCPDGTVLAAKDIEASEHHHEAGFNATSLCPVPPSVNLIGLAGSVQVYLKAPFTWEIDPGSVMHGHSMLTSIRYSTTSVPDADVSMQAYSKEIIKKEHQDLPKTFKGNLTFNVAGTVYVRAYAQVQGDGFASTDVWSDEVVLNVTPVQPTGTMHTVTHTLGPIEDLDPTELDAVLGDVLQFQNNDLIDHTLELTSAPPGATDCADLEAASMQPSTETCLFNVPGTYTFATDDTGAPKSLSVNVAQP